MGDGSLSMLIGVVGAAQVVGMTWVALRLLRVARRTRGAPEALMGTSLLALETIGMPLLIVSGSGADRVSELNLPLYALAVAATNVGSVCFMAFVWRVFRPNALAARGVMAFSAGLAVVHLVMSVMAIKRADPATPPMEAIGAWGPVMSGVMITTFAWGSAEALSYWGRLRKQLALGLTDEASVRRVGWFAVGCCTPLVMMGFVVSSILRKVNPHEDPSTALAIAACAIAVGIAFTRAFAAQRSAPQSA